ncbi:hypothetical protein F511_08001 [Dorcoceras hygrometricum]|uniref:Uncharacterized protein n=1 Tax=Dorcoceras hygrometricum TaxID=472368 RepID=A0A2Z7CEZ0_9LAMI|nr:hypothetical protein F511_08001 [Dorcoceras hygrometricum]
MPEHSPEQRTAGGHQRNFGRQPRRGPPSAKHGRAQEAELSAHRPSSSGAPHAPSLPSREHCDVLSMQIDSDLVIYRTTLVRTFQVVTICRVDKSESTRSFLGKCVYLVTLVMSLFDLQDVCIAIGSLATLDLPMFIDLIGIYGLKVPYCTLTTINWFLQELSAISRGSWGDVARRSYHDPMGKSGIVIPEPQWLWAHG